VGGLGESVAPQLVLLAYNTAIVDIIRTSSFTLADNLLYELHKEVPLKKLINTFHIALSLSSMEYTKAEMVA